MGAVSIFRDLPDGRSFLTRDFSDSTSHWPKIVAQPYIDGDSSFARGNRWQSAARGRQGPGGALPRTGGREVSLDTMLNFETEALVQTAMTRDKLEGTRAFVEKREPKFTGE